jgi:hypothetical protein
MNDMVGQDLSCKTFMNDFPTPHTNAIIIWQRLDETDKFKVKHWDTAFDGMMHRDLVGV